MARSGAFKSTLWHSSLLAEPPKKTLRKAQEWRRRLRGTVSELTIRKALRRALLKASEGDQMLHPNDIMMREEILIRAAPPGFGECQSMSPGGCGWIIVPILVVGCWITYTLPTRNNSKSSLYCGRLSSAGCPLGRASTVFRCGETYVRSRSLTWNVTGRRSLYHSSTRYQAPPSISNLSAPFYKPTLPWKASSSKLTSVLYHVPLDNPEGLIMAHLRHFELTVVALPLSTRNLVFPPFEYFDFP
jgi:hypothetical protein